MIKTRTRASKYASEAPAKADHVGKTEFAVEATAADLGSRDAFFCHGGEVSGSASGPTGGSAPSKSGLTSGLRSRGWWVRVPPRPPKDTTGEPRARLSARFWSKVDRSSVDGCWPWLGQITRKGYGRIQVGSRATKRGPRQAHQVAWELTHGPIPPGLVVRHVVCGNPACCRPSHLALGTQKQNCEDTVRMGRTTRGSRHPLAKLTDASVLAIRARRAAGESAAALASEMHVDAARVRQICKGEGWRHLPATEPAR
jgi:hypothetical protein